MNNIRDIRIRDRQISEFNKFWNKWNNRAYTQHLNQLNKDLFYFGCKLEPNEEDEEYYDLVALANNTMFGAKHPILYAYHIDELFEDDMYEEVRDALVGNIDDQDEKYDYYLTIDDIIKWVIKMNEEDGTNYDGIIVEDIHDTGPRGSWLDSQGTDIVTLVSSNQIKAITNKNPSSSNNINEEILEDTEYPCYVFRSVYEVKNMLLRNDKAYRIFYDANKDIYLLGDADYFIHDDLLVSAIEQGLYPDLKYYERHSYVDDNVEKDKVMYIIYTPNNLIKDTVGADLGEDGYNDLYKYDKFVITTRDADWKKCPLSKVLGQYKHFKHSYTADENNNYSKEIIEINEDKIKAYHSTEANFNKFDAHYIGSGAGTSYGEGFTLQVTLLMSMVKH